MEGSDRWPSHGRRRRLADLHGADEPDEGEFVPGHHYNPGSGVDMDTDKYYKNNRDCSSDSDATISDDSVPANNNGAARSSCPAAATVLACRFCRKEFRSHKAVCGHMKVHREQGIKKGREAKRDVAAVGSHWGATAHRGLPAESKIVLQPKPLAFAAPNLPPVSTASAMANESSQSGSPRPMHKDAIETVVARAANPPTEAVVHRHAAAAPPAAPVHQQLVAPPPPPPGERRSTEGYTCKKCGMWFRTPQGLGGHMVGHKNREMAPAAVQDVAVSYRSNAKREKMHVCKVCAAEFPGGEQLGGHMRKHWAGPPINKKPRFVVQPLPPPPPPPRTTTVSVADLTLALPVKADKEALPATRPAVPGRVLLFGIDIGPGVQTPAAQQGSSATVIGVFTSRNSQKNN